MARGKSKPEHSAKQAPKSGYAFLQVVLDGIDDEDLLEAVRPAKRTGRPPYSARALWRAYLSKYVLNIRYNIELLDRLSYSPKFREVCASPGTSPAKVLSVAFQLTCSATRKQWRNA